MKESQDEYALSIYAAFSEGFGGVPDGLRVVLGKFREIHWDPGAL